MMSQEIFSRNELFWGEDFQQNLLSKHVFIFGLGGVGGFAAESLVRAGIGHLTVVDFDTVSASNINRQIIALNSSIGLNKVELFKDRLLDINPKLNLRIFNEFYTEALNDKIFVQKPDFVIDAIDSMKAKIQLLKYCFENNIKAITSLGAGNRVDPTRLRICDISQIEKPNCSFMKNVLKNLEREGITSNLAVVISGEKPKSLQKNMTEDEIISNGEKIVIKKITPASTPFVPAVCGYYMGWWVISEILNN